MYGHSVVGNETRRRPRIADRRRVFDAQGDVCLYCELPIGTEILRTKRTSNVVTLRRAWDHFIPHAYIARNPGANWVIACHICNEIKKAGVFATVEEARAVILPLRERRGYEPVWSVVRRLNLGPR